METKDKLDFLYMSIRMDALKMRGLLDDGNMKEAQELAGEMIPIIQKTLDILEEMRNHA